MGAGWLSFESLVPRMLASAKGAQRFPPNGWLLGQGKGIWLCFPMWPVHPCQLAQPGTADV